jgi:hypothetical protein
MVHENKSSPNYLPAMRRMAASKMNARWPGASEPEIIARQRKCGLNTD